LLCIEAGKAARTLSGMALAISCVTDIRCPKTAQAMIDPVSSPSHSARRHGGRRPAQDACRALVPVHHQPRPAPAAAPARPSAAFLAHLIATAQQTPQTREKCRIEPRAAILAYQAVNARMELEPAQ